MSTVYISNDINHPCNIKKCTTETIESCCGCPEWFKWKHDIEQLDKRNPEQAYVGKHLKRIEKEAIKSWSPENETYSLVKWFASYNPEEGARKELYIKNYPYIDYEQDMGANIPFCQIDGNMCNVQCLKTP